MFADSTLGGQIPHTAAALLPAPSWDMDAIGDPAPSCWEAISAEEMTTYTQVARP